MKSHLFEFILLYLFAVTDMWSHYCIIDESNLTVRGSPNILADQCRPPLPPPAPEPALSPEQLTPATPTITVESKKDALTSDLKQCVELSLNT